MRNRNRALVFFSIAALPVAIAVWTAGLFFSRLLIGGFGLIAGLHGAWYVGVLIAVVGMLAAITTRRHSTLLTAYAIALVVMVVSTGMLLEGGPRFPYIFQSYTYGEQILRTGVIDYSQAYASWPGWHIFTSAAVGASGVNPSVVLKWLPLWMALVTLASLMTILRRYRLPRRQLWLAIALATVAFISPVYPTPASAGFVMVVFLVAIMLDEYVGGRTSVQGRFGVLVLFAAVVVTHLLTSVVGLITVIGVTILAMVVHRRAPGSAAVFGAVLIPTYLLYVAIVITAELLPGQIELIMNLDRLFAEIFGRTGAGIGGGSSDHTQVVYVRIAYVVGLAALAVLGGIAAIGGRTRSARWLFPSTWVAGGLAALGLGAYGGEILGRGSALAAPGSLALASWLARARLGRIVLSTAIVVAAAASPINHFGSELFDYVRPTELAADKVLNEHHPRPWNLIRQSRTWFHAAGDSSSGPYVVVYGPLFDVTSAFISTPDPPPMPFWSYDNGDVRIMVATERPR